MMFICGKGKDDYITGAATKTKADDPLYKTWKIENNLVMSWFIKSMTNDIGEDFILYETAQEIWDIVRETFSDKEDTTKSFEIEGILHDLRQEDLSVTQYFSCLSKYWQQLELYETTQSDCPMDAAKYKKVVEKKRIYKFLLGLNNRGRIISTKPSLVYEK